MTRRVRWAWAALALACVSLVGGCRQTMHVGTLDRAEVVLSVNADASVDVTETITTGVGVPAGRVLTRQIEPDQADGFEWISATVDAGVAPNSGSEAAGVTVARASGGATVAWQVPSTTGPHTLTLRYRAVRALFLDEPRARLTWTVWPAGHGFDVGAAPLAWVLPAGVQFYAGTGIGEAGWTVDRTPSGIVATRSNVLDAESATVLAEFDLLPKTMGEPAWQELRDRQLNYIPAYVSAALFMFVVGWGTLFLLRHQYQTGGADANASDADRLMVARGLRFTALVGGVFAVGLSAVSWYWLAFLGQWLQLIPGSMIIVAAVFLRAAARWEREGRS